MAVNRKSSGGPRSEYIKDICDLIRIEMDLEQKRVILYNQDYPIPADNSCFVAVSLLGKKPFGSSIELTTDPVDGVPVEQMTINTQETYQVLIYSRDGSARERNHEILWALVGTLAQQYQENRNFRIGTLPTAFTDVSEVEATTRLNRYALTFNVICAYQKARRLEYFDKFQEPPFQLLTNP